jgi:DNA repair exonuclease SbcCD ATPase subunit
MSDRSLQLVTLRDSLQEEQAEVQAEVEALGGRIELLTKVGELFRMLLDLLVVKQVRAIERVVTEGLQTVIDDQALHFEADVSPKYNKISVDFFIRRGAKDNPLSHRGKPLEAFGGGPSCVASLTLRILTVRRLGLWPFLALDEALGGVSGEYVDQTGKFLQGIAAKMGFDILIITHKPAFLDHADVAYRCSEGENEDGTTFLTIGGV